MILVVLLAMDTYFAHNRVTFVVVAGSGHGTAAALRDTFDENDYPQGSALSLCAATIGLLSGLLYGTLLINWAVSKVVVIDT